MLRVSRLTSSFSIGSPPAKRPGRRRCGYTTSAPISFTLKTNPLKRADLNDFVACYNPENRYDRKTSERFRPFEYEELVKRDKASLDIFWLKDESLEDSANLPDPDVIALEIAEDLEAALEQFSEIAAELKG